MKHIGRISFIAACLIICLFPFAGMLVKPTNTAMGNQELAKLPKIWENGKWNRNYMRELGVYFQDHFAFRPELVTVDALIQSRVFRVSNTDSVILGDNGWLYYTSTRKDYLRQNPMTEREISNAAHNLSLVQQYVKGQGASFLFTVAPNKNSLYGENMPYYFQRKASNARNMEMLAPKLKEYGVAYLDLFSLFEAQDEILYLKRDSHWNQKGAVLVFNALLNQLEVEHDTYETVKALRLKEEYGDLNRMLYPLAAEPEWNYFYQKEPGFTYVTDTGSVEDAWIETENKKGSGALLMFRDSFGNTLLPLMADTFSRGYFSRGEPQNIGEYMEQCQPDVVILEKVERNIREFAENPPLLEGPAADLDGETLEVDTDTTLELEENQNNTAYWTVSGILDKKYCTEDAKVYIRVADGEEEHVREAFLVSEEESDYGYRLYLLKDRIFHDAIRLQVLTGTGDGLRVVKSVQVKLDEVVGQ